MAEQIQLIFGKDTPPQPALNYVIIGFDYCSDVVLKFAVR